MADHDLTAVLLIFSSILVIVLSYVLRPDGPYRELSTPGVEIILLVASVINLVLACTMFLTRG